VGVLGRPNFKPIAITYRGALRNPKLWKFMMADDSKEKQMSSLFEPHLQIIKGT
jgi:hypothetical protein